MKRADPHSNSSGTEVASRVGAWIETKIIRQRSNLASTSPPAWGRGLKQKTLQRPNTDERVASRVGAWIETVKVSELLFLVAVASRVGAWIETLLNRRKNGLTNVASRVGAWIETGHHCMSRCRCRSPPAWGRGLKLSWGRQYGQISSRLPRGGVD